MTLVIMAGGLGVRFGGDKQLAPVGPCGETFFDYAIVDGLAAGAANVCIVVREDLSEVVRCHVATHHPRTPIAIVHDAGDAPRRRKPWGTGLGILSAEPHIADFFVAVNADDYYGRQPFEQIVPALAVCGQGEGAIVGFDARNRPTSHHDISQGILRVDERGRLIRIDEVRGFTANDSGGYTSTSPPETFPPGTLVSKNMWGLPSAVVGHLRRSFCEFLRTHGADIDREFTLSEAIAGLIAGDQIGIHVLRSSQRCVGVTAAADIVDARRALRDRPLRFVE